MEDGEKVCFVVSSERGSESWQQWCLTASCCCYIGSDASSVSSSSDIPLQCSSAMHKYTLMQTIQQHLDYISIIYNYSGIKIDLRLRLASCLRTAVLQQRLLCLESTAITTVDYFLTTNDDSKVQLQGWWGSLGALCFYQGLWWLNVICVGCKLAVLQQYGFRSHGLEEGACRFVSHHHLLWSLPDLGSLPRKFL